MFLLRSVCLSARQITEKLWTDFDEISWRGRDQGPRGLNLVTIQITVRIQESEVRGAGIGVLSAARKPSSSACLCADRTSVGSRGWLLGDTGCPRTGLSQVQSRRLAELCRWSRVGLRWTGEDTTDLVVLSETFHMEHQEYRRSAAGCLTLKKCAALGGKGGVISKGEDEWTLGVAVQQVVHIDEPQEGCKDWAVLVGVIVSHRCWQNFTCWEYPRGSFSSSTHSCTSACTGAKSGPAYLVDGLQRVTDIQSRQRMQSSSSSALIVPATCVTIDQGRIKILWCPKHLTV